MHKNREWEIVVTHVGALIDLKACELGKLNKMENCVALARNKTRTNSEE
jgi:hypothetical protein